MKCYDCAALAQLFDHLPRPPICGVHAMTEEDKRELVELREEVEMLEEDKALILQRQSLLEDELEAARHTCVDCGKST